MIIQFCTEFILQLLDFSSLEAYSLAIDTYLCNSLNISFDLNRKLKPWTHNVRQLPLKSCWKYESYNITDSHLDNQICKCRYCLDVICCTHDWYNRCVCDVCYCQFFCCWDLQKRWWLKRVTLTKDARKIIMKILEYRKQYKHPYTRFQLKNRSRLKIKRYSPNDVMKCSHLCLYGCWTWVYRKCMKVYQKWIESV